MRRLLFAALPTVLIALVTTGLAQEKHSHAFYPLKVGNQWTYRTEKAKVVVTVAKEVTFEYMSAADKVDRASGFVLKEKSGADELTEDVAVLTDGVYRFGTAGKAIKPPLCLLKFNLGAGGSWPVDSKTEDGKTIRGKFVANSETITLSLDGRKESVKTITATSQDLMIDREPMTLKYWFAENIGIVKEYVKIARHERTLELIAYKLVP